MLEGSIRSEAAFTKKIIDEVRSRRALYVRDDPNYYANSYKDNLWQQISESTGHSDSACRQRWKALRERFTKVRKKVLEAERKGEKFKEIWCYYNDLLFLKDCITIRGYTKVGNESGAPHLETNSIQSANEHDDENELSVLTFEDVEMPCNSRLTQSRSSSPLAIQQKRPRQISTSRTPSENKRLRLSDTKEPNLQDVFEKMCDVLSKFCEIKEKTYLSSSMDALHGLLKELPKDLQDACLMDMFKRVLEARNEARARE